MYDVSDILPADELPPGTNLLGVSPPMLRLRPLADRFLARGLDAGQGAVVVTTDRTAGAVAEAVEAHTASAPHGRLAVVDATGQAPPEDALPYDVEVVGSPADLTGIGIGVSEAVKRLHAQGLEGFRVVLDSLSSLLVYADVERVYQFAHTVTAMLAQADAVGLFLMNGDTDEAAVGQLQALFDGLLEARETEAGPEYRLQGLGTDPGWRPYDVPAGGPAEAEPVAADESEQPPDALAGAGSLHEMVESVAAEGYTLTVCNFTGDREVLAALREHFERLNVTVRTASLGTDTPADAALLHRGEDVLAASPVAALYNAVAWEAADAELSELETPDVLADVYRQEYTVENGGKLEMVRISRLIETRALEAGRGRLHAGFQRLERVRDELGTRELYERIADTDVDVHVYGRPGDLPSADRYTVHAADEGELADSWFVVYDGGGRAVRKGALVSEESAPERYTGFWTYRPGAVDAVDDYLRSTYG